jgi:hypothetical protein
MQDDWSDVTPDEAEELERACDEADEHQRQGVGVPVEVVLPRFRSHG